MLFDSGYGLCVQLEVDFPPDVFVFAPFIHWNPHLFMKPTGWTGRRHE